MNRIDAGKQLANGLTAFAGRLDTVILGLPRGGVPVASQVAQVLALPLDVLLVRKLGIPGQPEVAMGALAEGGVKVYNEAVLQQAQVDISARSQVEAQEQVILQQRVERYRQGMPMIPVKDKVVIVVDDGIATGATVRAALKVLTMMQVRHTVIAIPVAPQDALTQLSGLADEVFCLYIPDPFMAVGRFYDDFSQTTDEEVITALARPTLGK